MIPDAADDGFTDYLESSLRQLVLGNYTDDVTLLGTAGQVGLGLLGADLPADIRDIVYDVTHWDGSWQHALQTALDLVAILPLIGSIKYADEAAAASKGLLKNTDEAGDILNASKKAGAEAIDGAGDIGKIITEIKYKPSSGVILKAAPGKTTTILGSFDRDMKNIINELGNMKSTYTGANNGGFNILNVPDDMYKNADQFWDEVNVKWLAEAIARGDDFILATKPTTDALWKIDPLSRTKTLTGFGREYQHMLLTTDMSMIRYQT